MAAQTPAAHGAAGGGHGHYRPSWWRRVLGDHPGGWGFVLPATVLVLGMSVLPMVWSFLLSLTDSDLVSAGHWVGMRNYRHLVHDPAFRAALRHTFVFTAAYVPLSVGLGLALALLLNRRVRGIGLYRVCVFVPFVISPAAQGVLFSFVFDSRFGVANDLIGKAGVARQGFLDDPSQALYTLIGIALWGGAGFCVMVYLAALQDVPPQLMEAARIDGAGRWATFRHVILPALRPVTLFLVVWQTLGALQLFDLVFATTHGGPLQATTVAVYFVYDQAFQVFDAGYGAAAAYVLAVLIFAIGAAQVSWRLVARRRAA
jgi:multiple sugar transport system permease protein